MHHYQPHIDLRVNQSTNVAGDSMWPTFTDIISVVLMIFMLTMLTVIIKNTNFANQLKALKSRFDQSALDRATLESDLTRVQEHLRKKEMQNLLLSEEKQIAESRLARKTDEGLRLANELQLRSQRVEELQGQIALKQKELADYNVLRDTLEAKLALINDLEQDKKALGGRVILLEKGLALKDRQFAEREQQHARELRQRDTQLQTETQRLTQEMQAQIEAFNKRFAAVMVQLKEKEQVILRVKDTRARLELDLAKQRRNYSDLEERYNKLIRPARSPEGKSVVSVSYFRKGGKPQAMYKGVAGKRFEAVSMAQLHNRLTALRHRLGDKLYVKIIIPDDSRLSYNEAWSFTKEILSKYDYYHSQPAESDSQ